MWGRNFCITLSSACVLAGNHASFCKQTVCGHFSCQRMECRFESAFLVCRSFKMGKPVSWFPCCVTSFFRHNRPGRPDDRMSWRFGLILSQNLWHLADVREMPTGFFEILWISSLEKHQINMLLVFLLSMWSVNHFLFIHNKAFKSCSAIMQIYCGIKLWSECCLVKEAVPFMPSSRSWVCIQNERAVKT